MAQNSKLHVAEAMCCLEDSAVLCKEGNVHIWVHAIILQLVSKMRRDKKFQRPDQEQQRVRIEKGSGHKFGWLGAKGSISKFASSVNPMT